jgi:ABC-type branched-subunit amino acid transport system ATPase component
MNWVTEFCNRAILLEQGRIIAEGNPYDVVAIHREHSEQSKAERQAALDRAMKDGAVGSLPPDAARSRLRS